jgi:hypothetical protein
MYLVVIRCTADDVPAFLTADREEAFRVADDLDDREGNADWLEIDWDGSEFVQVSVVTFCNGRPVRSDGAGPSIDEEFRDAMGDQPDDD